MQSEEFPSAGDTRWRRHAGNAHYPAAFPRPCVACDTTYMHAFGCPKEDPIYDDQLDRNRAAVIHRRVNAVHIKARRNANSEPFMDWVGTPKWICPISECRDRMSDVQRKGEFSEKQTRLPMINAENFFRLVSLERPMSLEGRQPLPRHSKDHNKGRYNTTYCVDYLAPYSFTPKAPNPVEIDWSSAVRRMKSQFTDAADYRRNGRNTWLDESGIYANQDAKRKFFPVRNPLLEFQKPYVEERPKTQGSRSIFKPEGGDEPLTTKRDEKRVNFADEGCTDPWPKT